MRSKEEAIKNPMAGDRWRLVGADYPWNELVVVSVLSACSDRQVRYADHTSSWLPPLGFKNYLEDAEYLGGAE